MYVTVGDQHITLKQAIKCPRVVIDNRLRQQLTYIVGKRAATSCELDTILPNLGGPKQETSYC